MKLSITLTVFNEEKFLERCLASIKDIADEIVIVDGQSTDNTVKIAKKFQAKIISRPNDPINFHKNKKLANENAKGDWIFQLDADELVSKELAEEIIKTINSNPVENGFWIPRANYFLGRFLKSSFVCSSSSTFWLPIGCFRYSGRRSLKCFSTKRSTICSLMACGSWYF